MFIHQEKNSQYDIREIWIDLDKITSIRHSEEYEECYMVFINRDSKYRITQETFEKILVEKGVI